MDQQPKKREPTKSSITFGDRRYGIGREFADYQTTSQNCSPYNHTTMEAVGGANRPKPGEKYTPSRLIKVSNVFNSNLIAGDPRVNNKMSTVNRSLEGKQMDPVDYAKVEKASSALKAWGKVTHYQLGSNDRDHYQGNQTQTFQQHNPEQLRRVYEGRPDNVYLKRHKNDSASGHRYGDLPGTDPQLRYLPTTQCSYPPRDPSRENHKDRVYYMTGTHYRLGDDNRDHYQSHEHKQLKDTDVSKNAPGRGQAMRSNNMRLADTRNIPFENTSNHHEFYDKGFCANKSEEKARWRYQVGTHYQMGGDQRDHYKSYMTTAHPEYDVNDPRCRASGLKPHSGSSVRFGESFPVDIIQSVNRSNYRNTPAESPVTHPPTAKKTGSAIQFGDRTRDHITTQSLVFKQGQLQHLDVNKPMYDTTVKNKSAVILGHNRNANYYKVLNQPSRGIRPHSAMV